MCTASKLNQDAVGCPEETPQHPADFSSSSSSANFVAFFCESLAQGKRCVPRCIRNLLSGGQSTLVLTFSGFRQSLPCMYALHQEEEVVKRKRSVKFSCPAITTSELGGLKRNNFQISSWGRGFAWENIFGLTSVPKKNSFSETIFFLSHCSYFFSYFAFKILRIPHSFCSEVRGIEEGEEGEKERTLLFAFQGC